jgi:hypothetical protein
LIFHFADFQTKLMVSIDNRRGISPVAAGACKHYNEDTQKAERCTHHGAPAYYFAALSFVNEGLYFVLYLLLTSGTARLHTLGEQHFGAIIP